MSAAVSLGQLDMAPCRTGSWLRSRLADAVLQHMADQVERLAAPGDILAGITLQPNRSVRGGRPDAGISDADEQLHLSRFSLEMDRIYLGFDNRLRRQRRGRTRYVLAGQMGDGGMHYHGVAIVAADRWDRFEMWAEPCWRSMTRGGSLRLDLNPDGGWLAYATRHLVNPQEIGLHVLPPDRRDYAV